jgi:cytoskeletal protein CcmA (bactofilin family)
MLSKKKSNIISVDTFIGEKSFFEGNIDLEGTIRVDGKTVGEIKAEGDIIIGEKATISGNIFANNIIISGVVEGNVTARQQLRLTNTAKLTGDIKAHSLITDDGALFQGNCEMIENGPKQEKLPEASESLINGKKEKDKAVNK